MQKKIPPSEINHLAVLRWLVCFDYSVRRAGRDL